MVDWTYACCWILSIEMNSICYHHHHCRRDRHTRVARMTFYSNCISFRALRIIVVNSCLSLFFHSPKQMILNMLMFSLYALLNAKCKWLGVDLKCGVYFREE